MQSSNIYRSISGLLMAMALAQGALADERRAYQAPIHPKYTQECAACHIAYPAGMLPTDSWQRIMKNLPHHFGTDASLDPATVKELSTWLAANAGTYKRVTGAPSDDRITRSAWFIRKHREVSTNTWKLPAIKTASNCAACHTRANQGDFDEDYVRIPR
jgi:mono/diheme cytochrome c family protein